jgi:acyl transferase domain-containing protein/phosphopantetheinyl transferase (holo-ACP synthase)
MSSANSPTDIAIIGMSALYPGAKDLQTYWQNILNKVDAVHDAPDSWATPYYDPNSTVNDRIYTRKGGFLGDLAEFNPVEFGIMPKAVDGGEPDQFLALKLAREALKDAGYDQKPFNRQKAGIILGRGTYVNRGNINLMQHGLVVDQTITLLEQLAPHLDDETRKSIRQALIESLPPLTPEIAPGFVPNIITGRIANRLDLMGPNFIVDAACASSLVAVELAIRELLSDRCDLVIAGGVHASTPPPIYMVFCGLAALSRDKIRPFDASSNGTLLGEGVGMVVLKKLRDAERDGDRIYAVIKGVGSSSDGKALGLLAPRLEGEVLALQRVYGEDTIAPETIGLIEAHGTGIALGDRTEVQSLTAVFGPRQGQMPHCALGSVKSLIGHCIPAAGSASLIKTALALYHKILPPTLCENVNPALEIEKTPFYINTETRPWIHGNSKAPRRAGVNAFGFGGVNAHAVLEEYRGSETNHQLLHQQWATELLIFSGDERQQVIELINQVQRQLLDDSLTIANLAYTLSTQAVGKHRLVIIAKDIADLEKKLNTATEKLKEPKDHWQTRTGIYYTAVTVTPQPIALLFPGEGSQYPNMLADLCLYFPQVRQWFDFLDETFSERKQPPSRFIFPPPTSLTEAESQQANAQLFQMDLASEIVFTSSMALYELLSDFGIKSDFMLGHSTGENVALMASRTIRELSRTELMSKIRLFNKIYHKLNEADCIPKGALLSVGAVEPTLLQKVIESFQGRLHFAMDNCPNQAVLFGNEADINQAEVELTTAGGIISRLPFDRAYHTPLFDDVAKAFREFYDAVDVGVGETCLYSCATASLFPTEPEAIRSLAAKQWSSRVRFQETVEALYKEGVRTFIEVGPKGNLTAFVQDILKGKEHLALSSNSQRISGLEQIQHLLARLLINGIKIDFAPLYRLRNLKAIDLDAEVVEKITQKKSLVLNVEMPVMRLQPEFVKQIQDKINLASETKLSVVDAPIPVVSNLPQMPPPNQGYQEENKNGNLSASLAKEGLKAVNDDSINTRLAIVSGHFDLMQEFLANQSRVTAAFYSRDNTSTATALTFTETYPFLGQIIESDSEHLLAERLFDLNQDVFLQDHTLGGKVSQRHPELYPLPVIPFTFSMEMIAEAAVYLVGGDKVVAGLDNLRGYRWLALDHGQLLLQISAKILPQQNAQTWDVYVQLFQSAATEAGQNLVFEGYIKLVDQLQPAPFPQNFSLEFPESSQSADEDLYRLGMFHGWRLQGVKHIRKWSKQGMEAELEVLPLDDFFTNIHRPIFRTDAGLLDAAGQLIGYWLTEQFGPDVNCFPFQIKAFQQYVKPLPPGSKILCRALIEFTSSSQIQAQFELLDEKGLVIARLEQWTDRYYTVPHNFYQCRLQPQNSYLSTAWMQSETGLVCRRIDPFPDHFLDDSWAIWKRVLAHLMLNQAERDFWYKLPEKGGRRTEWLLGRIAAKEALRQLAKQTFNLELASADIEILPNDLGKPLVSCPELEAMGWLPNVSISHSRGYIIAAVAPAHMQLGIDLERLDIPRPDDWLVGAFTEQELSLVPQINQKITAGFWCAKEAASKAFGTGLKGVPQQWQITQYAQKEQLVTVVHQGKSVRVKTWCEENEILAICLYSGKQ